jgi:glutamate-1-semialdehyde 2,1-aminomutase
MAAIHLARGATERDLIIKVEGSYDGHHDAVMVSCYPELDELGPRESPNPVAFGRGYPQAVVELTVPVPFNDAEILEATFERHQGRIAGMIIEPAMMNINIIPPRDGYLERARELCDEHGAKLIFDEVKTGATIAYGGASQRFGVQADVVCLAKAIAGGYPGGAIGMTAELGEVVASDKVHQIGTFNGNPLVMAAAEATLTEVLTPEAYEKLDASNEALKARCQEVIDRYALPAYTQGLGAKGCVIFSSEPIYEYRDYLNKVDGELSTLAWLYHMNNGIFMTPGVEEEWTLSIAHEQEYIDRYVAAFEAFAVDVSGS